MLKMSQSVNNPLILEERIAELKRINAKLEKQLTKLQRKMAANTQTAIKNGNSVSVNRKANDAVFTDLFSKKENVLQIYRTYHPEDTVTVDDITILTLDSRLLNQQYNDLAFMVKNQILFLFEEQTKWTVNIVLRMLMYLVEIWMKYIQINGLDIYQYSRLELPVPEFYVVYVGDRKDRPETLSLKDDLFGGQEVNVDLKVKMLYGQPRKSAEESWENEPILDQYVEFTRVRNDQIAQNGRTEKAILETLRICIEHGVLKEYLSEERQEVIHIIRTLFDEETILRNHINAQRREAARKELDAVAEMMIKDGEPGDKIIRYTKLDRTHIDAMARRLNRTVSWEEARA